jgi:citrate lyase subunit beta/citryl-CoA lyase
MIEKAAASSTDAICIDLEDAVALDEKPASRANVIRAFQQLDFAHRIRVFRINGLDTPFAYRDLIEVVEAVGARIDLVMLPKVGSAYDIAFVDQLLTQIEAAHNLPHPIGIEAQIETAAGFLNIREIATASVRLETLIYGPGDYAASLRMPLASIGERDSYDEHYPGHRWQSVMHTIVAAARAHGLRCLDGPFAGLKDPTGLAHASLTARALGFDGKQCIHPAQLETVNVTFSPSESELAWAQQVVAAYQAASAAGRGAFSIDGKMIDAANLRMAEVVVAQQQLLAQR